MLALCGAAWYNQNIRSIYDWLQEASLSTYELPQTAALQHEEEDESAEENLFAALDEEEEGRGDGDTVYTGDEPEAEPAVDDSLLPPGMARAPYALPFAPQLDVRPRPYQTEAV